MGVRSHDHDHDNHDHDHDNHDDTAVTGGLIGAVGAASDVARDRNGALMAWYTSSARDLPWRPADEPYRVLVSEVMLQQTQAERVIPYFERFLERFPMIEDLAEAPLRDVLSAWNGLGYNARARRLHQTASSIVADGWPQTVEGLERLPGVGPYTARALACLAFNIDVVPVDTNIRRVLSRWRGEPLKGRVLQAAAEAEVRDRSAATWSQAVMDLGAMLCRPRAARCEICPVEQWCSGPEIYVPPRPQARFEGSRRQLRGAIVRTLVSGAATVDALATETGFHPAEVGETLAKLEHEGLVERAGALCRLPP